MAFNQEYYDGKKKKLDSKFQRKINQSFQQIIDIVNLFLQEQRELRAEYQEVEKEEAESKKDSGKNSEKNSGKEKEPAKEEKKEEKSKSAAKEKK